jgi:ribose transport system substrate-binding protein
MEKRRKLLDTRRKRQTLYVSLVGITLIFAQSCNRTAPLQIALIPRTAGMGLWEPEHRGADAAATKIGAQIYWNAPTREDDVEGQIALIDQIINRGYQGLIIAPDQTLALITPVRRALARNIPTVIVSSPLPIPPGDELFYVLNDDEAAGRMAAQRVAQLLHGRGFVIVLGVNPDIAGIMIRARSFELYLTQNYPNIRIAKRRGSFNALHEQQTVEEVLKLNPKVDAIVGLMWPSTRAALTAVRAMPDPDAVKVIGFDPDGAPLPFDIPNLDSVVMQDTEAMGERAVELVAAELSGRDAPRSIKFQPTLVTRDNINDPTIHKLIWMDWKAFPDDVVVIR